MLVNGSAVPGLDVPDADARLGQHVPLRVQRGTLQRHDRHRHRPLPPEHVLRQLQHGGHAERRRDRAVLPRHAPLPSGQPQPAAADRRAREPDERRVADRAGAERAPLHRRHVPEPRRRPDQQAEHHRRRRRVHDHRRGRRRPRGRRAEPPDPRRRAEPRRRDRRTRRPRSRTATSSRTRTRRTRSTSSSPARSRSRSTTHVVLHRREPRDGDVHRSRTPTARA